MLNEHANSIPFSNADQKFLYLNNVGILRSDNWWNTDSCITYHGETQNLTVINQTVDMEDPTSAISNTSTLSVVEYWNNFVLRKTSGLEDMGTLENWPLILSFLGAWVVCYFCTFKGVKSTGKVVYFTATFPYFVLLIMLVKGCTLPGAVDGIKYYLEPNITKLADPQVWVDAASQIVYTYGICFATLITFASYNQFNHDCFKHSVKLVIACSLTSFVTGFAVFTVVGNLAHVQNITVSKLELSGPGLIFLVFPTALSLMPLPNMWNAFFFFMIIIIGIDSQFSGMEVVTTVVYDQWSHHLSKKYRRELMVLAITIIYIIIGIPLVMEGGIYVFELYNNYAVGGIALIWLTMMEAIGIAHIYGADRFCDDIELMIGYKVTTLFKICIMWVTPLLTGSILLFYIIQYAPPVVDKVYHYSAGAQAVGWMMTMSTFLCIPIFALYRIYIAKGDTILQKLRESARPRYPSHIEKYRREKEMNELEGSEREIFVKKEIFPVECITVESETP